MINQIMNILRLKGTPASVQQTLDSVKGESNTNNEIFDLNKILPMPVPVEVAAEAASLGKLIQKRFPRQSALFQQVLAKAEYDCLANTGYATANDWAWDNWGTIKNVYGCKYNKAFPTELVFNSLYEPPLAALAALSRNFPAVVVELYYENRDRTISGWALFADGDGCEQRRDWTSLEKGGVE